MPAVLRALEVLEQLAGMRQPAALDDVAAHVGLSSSQTYRVLAVLEHEGYVDHIGRSGYRLGPHAVALGTLIGPRPALVRAVRPALGRLAAASGAATVLHLRSAASRVLILGIPAPTGPVRDPGAVLGERSPLTVGASGRVILAHLRPEETDRLRGRVTTRTLGRIRERGYDTSAGENHPGVSGVSGPLLDTDGLAIGSITIAGPATRLEGERILRHVAPLLATCRELSPIVAALLGPDPGPVLDALDL